MPRPFAGRGTVAFRIEIATNIGQPEAFERVLPHRRLGLVRSTDSSGRTTTWSSRTSTGMRFAGPIPPRASGTPLTTPARSGAAHRAPQW